VEMIDVEQGSYEWHCMRQGKVTGTSVKSALGTKKVQDTLMYKLISERMTEPQITEINTTAVVRGTEVEPLARKAVIKETGIEFIETGMLIHNTIEHFGLSPDAVFLENGLVVGGLEIKCPDSKKHIEYAIKGEVPKEYLDQVKAPFIMDDDIRWWVFASFDDRNYEMPLFIKVLHRRDFTTIDADRKKIVEFLETVDKTHSGLTF
jgi:hypothetical protein